ncbi:MAG: manganese catalase family protein [Clostridia bacterium]
MKCKQAKELLDSLQYVPYPVLRNVKPDRDLADRMFRSYGGYEGEVTAVTLYIYQHIQFEDENLKEIMLEIAKIEIHHLVLIGGLIKQLGDRPEYRDDTGKFWCADRLNYVTKDILKTMEYDIEQEQNTIDNYEFEKSYTDNKSIRDLLDRIILDETVHKKIFKGIAEDYKRGKYKI